MGEKALKLELQKSFTVLKQITNDLTTVKSDTEPVIQSLANLLEQYECCQSVDRADIPFINTCPDLKEKLRFKLVTELETKVAVLQSHIDKLQEGHSKILQKYNNVMKVYRRHSCKDLCVDTMMQTTTMYPTLADMMDFLNTAEHLLFENYQCKRFLIEELISSSKITSENLLLLWTAEDMAIIDTLSDYLRYVVYLMDEKF